MGNERRKRKGEEKNGREEKEGNEGMKEAYGTDKKKRKGDEGRERAEKRKEYKRREGNDI